MINLTDFRCLYLVKSQSISSPIQDKQYNRTYHSLIKGGSGEASGMPCICIYTSLETFTNHTIQIGDVFHGTHEDQ